MPRFTRGPGGSHRALNITAPAAILSTQGIVYRVFVNTAPSAAGGIYDVSATGSIAPANLIRAIPAGYTGTLELVCPLESGLVIDPGTDGVAAATYEVTPSTD